MSLPPLGKGGCDLPLHRPVLQPPFCASTLHVHGSKLSFLRFGSGASARCLGPARRTSLGSLLARAGARTRVGIVNFGTFR